MRRSVKLNLASFAALARTPFALLVELLSKVCAFGAICQAVSQSGADVSIQRGNLALFAGFV